MKYGEDVLVHMELCYEVGVQMLIPRKSGGACNSSRRDLTEAVSICRIRAAELSKNSGRVKANCTTCKPRSLNLVSENPTEHRKAVDHGSWTDCDAEVLEAAR